MLFSDEGVEFFEEDRIIIVVLLIMLSCLFSSFWFSTFVSLRIKDEDY